MLYQRRPIFSGIALVLLSHIVQGCGVDELQADQRTTQAPASGDAVPQAPEPAPEPELIPAVENEDPVVEAAPEVPAEAPTPEAPVVVKEPEAPKPVEDAPSDGKDEPKLPDPRYSLGGGGATGFVEQDFTAANGLKSSYKIMVPADASATKPYGLHVHLHGDGGGGYQDFPNQEMREDLIGVTVKAPNASLRWGRAAGKTHGEYLQDLIQSELVKKYNVDLKRIYFSGVSGGAFFLAGNFIPSFGKVYRSGAFLMCGGEAPRVAFDEPEFLKDFQIHWQVTAGERRDILTSVGQSMRAYRAALTDVGGDAKRQDSEIKGPGGHCEFDDERYTSGIQYMMDLNFKIVLKPELKTL